MTRSLALFVLISLFGFRGSVRTAPHEIAITGTDYAFQIPQRIESGETTFTFENRGTVRHEMSILMLKPTANVDSVLAEITAGSRRRDFVDGQAALIVAAPRETPGPKLLFDLKRGRSYVVLCNLKDAPDKPGHLTLGMFAKFTPQ